MNNQTKIISIGLLIVFLGLFSYIYVTNFTNQFENENVTPKLDNNTLTIIVSTHHLSELTKAIGGEKIILIKLIPDGVEPHDWEPMSEDIIAINQADLLFHNGLGLEPWIKNFSNNEKLKIINVSEDIPESMIISTDSKIEDEHDQHEDEHDQHEDEHDQHTTDPHVWLDPILVKYQVNKIKNTLMMFDSENKDLYNSNGNLYIKKLDKLDEDIKTELSVCSNDKKLFITLHESFNYFSKRYELNSISLRGLHHHQEPNPNDLLEIISIAKNNNITKIYVEPDFNPDLGKTIAEEIDGEVLILDPFETGEKDYNATMMSNIANLKKGFNCG